MKLRLQVIPPQRKLGDLRQSWSLASDDHRFSSFAYRVEAVRILRMVLAVLSHRSSGFEDEDTEIETIDACLVGTLLHLPRSRLEPYGSNGNDDFDEMTFQTQMIVYL